MNTMGKTISIRMPDELYNKLFTVAKETERSKSFLVIKALELYLKDQADLQIALDRLHDTNDETISYDAMRKTLGV